MTEAAAPVSTLLEELTRDFPNDIKLKIRETLDRTKIRNHDDPIFELMIVLGTWARYYQTIPQGVREAGAAVDARSQESMKSFDTRLALLRGLALAIQNAVDRLEGAPQAIVDKFPAEAMAKNIAAKVDVHFKELPLTRVENAVSSLHGTLKTFVGEEARPEEQRPAVWGLAQRMQDNLDRLQRSAASLAQMKFPDRASVLRDLLFALIGAGIVWIFGSQAVLRDIREELQKIYAEKSSGQTQQEPQRTEKKFYSEKY